MKREDDLGPTSGLELKVLPLGYKGSSCLLRFISVDTGNHIAENKSERRNVLFEYFRPEDREYFATLLRPTGVDFNKIRQWLSSCESTDYRSCNPIRTESSMTHLNLMVMDCVGKRMILLPTGDIRYSTLSYVWGESQPSCHLDLGSEIDIHALERTTRDAITVSLELGLRYLWVDRYCTSQSNPTERHLQLHHMGEIYSNSFITIIACAGRDAETGLPGVGTTSRNNNLSVLAETWSLQSVVPQPTVEITDSAWFTRGWTFQEGMLARRRLIFSQSSVYFQCAIGHKQEQVRKILDTERATRRIELLPAMMDKSVFPRYGSGQQARDILPLISQYWARRFTYETDALDAFRGILSTYMVFKGLAGHVQGLP
ncbi:HET-domain-containing protein, partial [Pyrenochaeta sp. DS3sAY3a]